MHRGEKEANLQSLLRCKQQRQIQFRRSQSRKKGQMQTRGDQEKSFQSAMLKKIQLNNHCSYLSHVFQLVFTDKCLY